MNAARASARVGFGAFALAVATVASAFVAAAVETPASPSADPRVHGDSLPVLGLALLFVGGLAMIAAGVLLFSSLALAAFGRGALRRWEIGVAMGLLVPAAIVGAALGAFNSPTTAAAILAAGVLGLGAGALAWRRTVATPSTA